MFYVNNETLILFTRKNIHTYARSESFALPTILLDAKTLLTETITIAAIAANINFFIILSFFNCYYINVTYLLCGFIIEPAIHNHNLRAKSMSKNDMSWLSGVYIEYAKNRWCGKWGKNVETFPKKLGNYPNITSWGIKWLLSLLIQLRTMAVRQMEK